MFGPVKFIMTAIGLVLIGIAVALILLSTPLRDLARQRFADALGKHYGAEATVDAIRLVPLEHGVELRGITVYNPEPFPKEPAFECERVLLRVDPATLFSPRPTIASVEVEEPKLHVRYDLGKGSNIGSLFSYAASRESAVPNEEGRRMVVVQKCSASDAKVTVTSNALIGTPLPINVAAFRVKEVSEANPVSGWKISREFLKTLLMETVTVKGLLNPVVEMLQEELGSGRNV